MSQIKLKIKPSAVEILCEKGGGTNLDYQITISTNRPYNYVQTAKSADGGDVGVIFRFTVIQEEFLDFVFLPLHIL
ncbi:MAG: hypothetical protein M3136_12190 [Thermoproteota archaeon]|jgi:hypothetical protein|nr:hypothetical protein [Thermoproteota archaeon]